MYLIKSLKLILVLLLSTTFVLAQTQKVSNAASITAKTSSEVKPVPIDTHPNLIKLEKEIAELVKRNPRMMQTQLNKITAVDYSVGDKKILWAYNYEDDTFYQTASTCQGVGTYCDVFVEDSVWGTRVTQTVVDNVIEAFDNSTPADSSKGIYETVTDVFGDCPDIDNDGKIIILILNIKDGYTPSSGSYVGGYFYSVNEYTQEFLDNNGGSKYKSNEAETFYMDCNPADLSTENGLENVLNTTAHEFQHMVHWNYHGNPEVNNNSQTTFYNEGCSEIAPYICGYGLRSHSLFTLNTNRSLDTWDNSSDDVLIDYARASRYFLYLYEQFGTEFLTKFVQNYLWGYNAVNAVLSNMSTGRDFNDVLVDFSIANTLNNKAYDSRWGYDAENLSTAEGTVQWNVNVGSTTITLENWGSEYVTYKGGDNLNVNITDNSSNMIYKAIKVGDNINDVVDIQAGTQFSEPSFGSVYDKVTILAVNTSTSNDYDFSYSSNGNSANNIVEIKYDNNTPDGVYLLSVGDTVCVYFDGISGGKLDSIKVALRQAGSLSGGLWEYTGAARPSPLGTKLTDITATSTIAERPSAPYPDPWPNWVTVDLTSLNIDATNAFVAGFVIDGEYNGDGTGGNRIMNCTIDGSTAYHSYTYLHESGSGNPDWYYLTPETGKLSLYMIRAYVSTTGVTGTQEIVELLPTDFNLENNYPNPFNPSTKIRYSLPQATNVKLSIYNSTGKKIADLVNTYQHAGNFEINWDGKNKEGQRVASGIYFYRIQAGNFAQTKKMMLLK